MAISRNTLHARSSMAAAGQGFFDQIGVIGGIGGVPLITEAEIRAMSVGTYRGLLNDGIAAIRSFDWPSMREILDDPEVSPQLPPEARALLEDAINTQGEALVALLEQGLALVDGYGDAEILGEIFTDTPEPPVGPGFDFDLDDFDTTADRLQDHAGSYGWGMEATGEDIAFTSPTFRFDEPGGAWSVLGDLPERGGAGQTASEFLSAVGEVVGDAVVTILGRAEGVLGSLISGGGTAGDLAEAWEVGTSAGEEFGDVLQYGMDGFYDGTLDIQELDARAKGAVRNFVADLVGLIPGAGATVRNIVFGTRNSDVTVVVGSDATLFNGSSHGDRFLLGAAHNRFNGGAGRDALFGLDGNDSLRGGSGADVLLGGRGADRLDGGTGADSLHGGSGADRLFGQSGNDVLFGSAGNDSLSGGAHRDLLRGGDGRDTLLGGTGNDTLSGGAGNDRLIGGVGRDVFVFGRGGGKDTIADFRNGADRIDLGDGLRFRDVNETTIPGGVRLTFDGAPGLSLTVMGITAAQLGAEDFL